MENDSPVTAIVQPTPQEIREISQVDQHQAAKVALEMALAHCIKQMMGALDGFTALAFLDQDMNRMKSPAQHALDQVGGVDGMRVTFRGQAMHCLNVAPVERGRLSERHKAALTCLDEHVARSAAFGNWLTEKTAPHACVECIAILSVLHLVMLPMHKQHMRDVFMGQYFRGEEVRTPY